LEIEKSALKGFSAQLLDSFFGWCVNMNEADDLLNNTATALSDVKLQHVSSAHHVGPNVLSQLTLVVQVLRQSGYEQRHKVALFISLGGGWVLRRSNITQLVNKAVVWVSAFRLSLVPLVALVVAEAI
jgi:hypothetical protein